MVDDFPGSAKVFDDCISPYSLGIYEGGEVVWVFGEVLHQEYIYSYESYLLGVGENLKTGVIKLEKFVHIVLQQAFVHIFFDELHVAVIPGSGNNIF